MGAVAGHTAVAGHIAGPGHTAAAVAPWRIAAGQVVVADSVEQRRRLNILTRGRLLAAQIIMHKF